MLALCEDKRGTQTDLRFPTAGRAVIEYDLPLSEIVFDFYDRLKSTSRGYASLDYETRRASASRRWSSSTC